MLLDIKTQESYYHKITARYMQFCTQYSKNLNEAFASLSVDGSTSASADPTRNPPVRPVQTQSLRPTTPAYSARQTSATRTSTQNMAGPNPADGLSIILTALRKLREGLLATSHTVASPVFSQRVHVFNIRLAILALHPPSYHPSLRYLLTVLHTKEHPLPASELREMMVYHILDTALREGDMNKAHALRVRAKASYGIVDRNLDTILKAVVWDDWPLFWQIRSKVDGYIRAIMHWHLDVIRKSTLKAIGRAYMKCDVLWIVQGATGGEMSWEELVEKEDVGWSRDGDTVHIRKPKAKT